jgi:hypothetical protein
VVRGALSLAIVPWLVALGCSDPTVMPDGSVGRPDGALVDGAARDAAPVDAASFDGRAPGVPRLGAHGLSFYRYMANSPPTISTPAMTTQPAGSTMIVSVGRGDDSAFALPTDNRNDAAQQLGAMHTYTRWPTSGTAVYAFPSVAGSPGYAITTTTPPADEITLAAVEVADGAKIQSFEWTEILGGAGPLTSPIVTTTGPATLIAFWWGDGFFDVPQDATPDSGFTILDAVVKETGSFVQCAVAAKSVDQAGTYQVTWTATPAQGAQLWLIAVQ